ncbi:hypothetical protein SMD11_4753 [Streptomyces albireticuli]|uniref:Integral membrane protein n=1 Tax=Streptomyces albireticuli TaxID=1940 RepID=A0A1Z2L7R2_9ACTN|nr:DUF6114 domain-containing protein [Streptomyces albireticuli]ARZ70346.1 hypothetical protein SMD11_4753 [Streptomyces albireticuli]
MAAGIHTGRARRHPWAAWRRWRKGRPFWGGLACVLAGAEICAIPLAPLEIMIHQGIAGIPSVLMGLIMIIMGLTAWFAPHYRTLAGILTVLVAAAALVMSNLGGFLIGTLLGIVGGGMIFAWQPLTAPAAPGSEPAPEPVPEPPAAPPHDEPSGAALPADGKAWPPPPRVPPQPSASPSPASPPSPSPDGGILPPPREPRESA